MALRLLFLSIAATLIVGADNLMAASFYRLDVLLNTQQASGTVIINELELLDSTSIIVREGSAANDDGRAGGTYGARAEFGNIGVSLSLFSIAEQNLLVNSPSGFSTVQMGDEFFFEGIQSGILAIDYLVEGSLSFPPTAAPLSLGFDGISSSFSINSPNFLNILSGYATNPNTGIPEYRVDTNGSQTGGLTSVTSLENNVFQVSHSGTVYVPFQNAFASLNVILGASGQCSALFFTRPSCSTSSDFFGSAKLGGAIVLDENLQPVEGATFTSDSGFDYTTPLNIEDVPEPGTLVSGALGLMMLGYAQWRRRLG